MGKFQNFQAQTRLKKVALTVIAQQLQDDDIGQLKSIFTALDKNGDGTLTASEIKEGMEKAKVQIPDDLVALMKQIDSDGSGSIDYTEFIASTMDKRLYIKEDVCWSAFRVFDLDGDGKITKQELAAVLSGGDQELLKKTFRPDVIDAMIADADKNSDGI